MHEQPLTLRFVLRAISRHRLFLCTVVLIGALAGIVYGVERPPLPSASALILLPPSNQSNQSSSGTSTSGMNATEIVIATSTPVLSTAGRAVSPPVEPQVLKHDVTVTALSEDILQVMVQYPQARDAVRLANAVAASYVYFVTRAPTPAVENQLAGLQQQADQLTEQIQNLQSQVNAASGRLSRENSSSPHGQQDAALIQSLRNRENQYSLELGNVTNQIATAQLSTGPSAVGTGVLQRAVGVVPTSKLRLGIDGVIGLAAGLLVGILLVLMRSRRDRRLRLRDEIAGSIGAPVLGSLHAQACKNSEDWRKLIEHHTLSATETWTVHRALNALVNEHTGAPGLRVVAFADDGPALAAGAQLALSAAEVGIPTDLLPSDHAALAPLRAASRLLGGSPDILALACEVTDSVPGRLNLSLVPVERDQPQLPPSDCSNLLAISSGAATAEDLARLGLAAADAHDGIAGIVVVNPEPNDPTSGSFLEGPVVQRAPVRRLTPTIERIQLMENPRSISGQK